MSQPQNLILFDCIYESKEYIYIRDFDKDY